MRTQSNTSRQLNKMLAKKDPEMSTVSQMIAGRNQIYCEPFDVFDPNHPLRGKKRFNENFRPLRSKINLKIGGLNKQLQPEKTN